MERISGKVSMANLGTSEVGLVFFQLHHKVVDIDELSPGRQGPKLGLRQHPVEAMINLDQLGQCSLDRENQGEIRLGGADADDKSKVGGYSEH